jgi:hypothetical protein
MTIEEKLKDLILSRYKSIREFTIIIDMPYTTIDSIFRRGVGNSSVSNVIKICKALGISADELADGKIVSVQNHIITGDLSEIKDILSDAKARMIHHDNLTFDGEPVDDHTVDAIVQGIDVSLELAKRHNKNHNKNHNKS